MVSLTSANTNRFNGILSVTENYEGLSADTKPILPPDRNGSVFYEMDTQEVFKWDGENLVWITQ